MQDMFNKRFDKQAGKFIICKYSEEFVWEQRQKNPPLLVEIKTYE